MVSEVPLGAFLSGGLDSTLVVSSMAKAIRRPVLTNSIGFTGVQDELHLARLVSEQFSTDHREFTITPDSMAILPQIAYHFDEPFADSSAIPTWYVCQMAKKNVTVAISGDGGDETFGGYTFRYLPHMYESRLRKGIPSLVRSLVFGSLGKVWPSAAWLPKALRLKTILENLSTSDAEAFYHDLVWLRDDDRMKVYSPSFIEMLKGFHPFELISPLYTRSTDYEYNGKGAVSSLMRAQYTDINFYMTEDVLVKVDRMSMAHSMEVRSPLLDYRIIEFAATLPDSLKLERYKGKIVPRNLASRRLPKEILKQPKTGFSVPVSEWLRKELREIVEAALSKRNGVIAEVFQRDALRNIWQEHLKGQRDHSVFLWSIVMLDMWEENVFKETR
jgi:asparagine synthase (glutamine-hydrolysing)